MNDRTLYSLYGFISEIIGGPEITWVGSADSSDDMEHWLRTLKDKGLGGVTEINVSETLPRLMIGIFANGEAFCEASVAQGLDSVDFWETVPDPETN